MHLKLTDPKYTERLASFFQSLGQSAVVVAADRVELVGEGEPLPRAELEIYLRVWQVLYPDARIEVLEQL